MRWVQLGWLQWRQCRGKARDVPAALEFFWLIPTHVNSCQITWPLETVLVSLQFCPNWTSGLIQWTSLRSHGRIEQLKKSMISTDLNSSSSTCHDLSLMNLMQCHLLLVNSSISLQCIVCKKMRREWTNAMQHKNNEQHVVALMANTISD